jgi:NADH-quinone oxidoreductase subunit J
MIAQVYFWLFSTLALLSALGVLVSRHPIHGAISLIGALVSLAGIYSLIGSPFVATIQILVYAGAIIVLLVFVIMVLNFAKDHTTPLWDTISSFALLPAAATGALLLRFLLVANDRHSFALDPKEQPAVRGTVEAVSTRLFPNPIGGWSFLFLVVGLLLLSAIVGAVLLAKRHLGPPDAAKSTSHHGDH